MKFAKLAKYFERMEGTSLRNEMMEIFAELLREAESGEVEQVVNLSLGQLRPKFDRLEFNLAEKMVVRALRQAQGKLEEIEIIQMYKELGDLGLVIAKMRSSDHSLKQGSELSVGEVYEELVGIAEEGGQGSQERKVERLGKLFGKLTGVEAKYVVRMVLGKLRLGFSDKTVLDAISYLEYGSKEGRRALDDAYQVFPDVGKIARYVKQSRIDSLKDKVRVTLGTPVMPALAQRLKTADEMIAKMGEVMCEGKYDGTRVQIHFARSKINSNLQFTIYNQDSNINNQTEMFGHDPSKADVAGWVRTFTRNLDESSAMFPELAGIGAEIQANEVILDSEAVGYDPKTGKQVPFQLTITRKRKHGVGEARAEVPLKFFVFDILYLNGESLLAMPLRERRKILEETIVMNKQTNKPISGIGGVLVVDEALVTDKAEKLREYHKQKLAEGLEGAMVKKIEGEYLPGRQDFNWVKFKESEDSQAKLADTLDVVVMGYYKGRGKRTKFGMGAFLVGVADDQDERGKTKEERRIVTIAKVGTGLSDVQFQKLYTQMKEVRRKTKDNRYEVAKNLEPDVWVEPVIVVEVAADEVTQSPMHTSGMALRFPRLIRFREDKDLSGVTTVQEVKEIAGI